MFTPLPQKFFYIFIFSLAVLFFGGIIYFNNLFNTSPAFLKLSSLIPLTSLPQSITLKISSPDDNLMVFDPDLLIDGVTSPNSIVIITDEDLDRVVTTNNQGYFSYTAHLSEGINQFQINVFDNYGNSKSEFRSIYYSKEKI